MRPYTLVFIGGTDDKTRLTGADTAPYMIQGIPGMSRYRRLMTIHELNADVALYVVDCDPALSNVNDAMTYIAQNWTTPQ